MQHRSRVNPRRPSVGWSRGFGIGTTLFFALSLVVSAGCAAASVMGNRKRFMAMIQFYEYGEIRDSYTSIQSYFDKFEWINCINLDTKIESDLGFSGLDFEMILFEIAERNNLSIESVDLSDVYFGEGEYMHLALLSIPMDLFDCIRYVKRKVSGEKTDNLFRNFEKFRSRIYGERKDITVRQLMIWVLTGKLYDHEQVLIRSVVSR